MISLSLHNSSHNTNNFCLSLHVIVVQIQVLLSYNFLSGSFSLRVCLYVEIGRYKNPKSLCISVIVHLIRKLECCKQASSILIIKSCILAILRHMEKFPFGKVPTLRGEGMEKFPPLNRGELCLLTRKIPFFSSLEIQKNPQI